MNTPFAHWNASQQARFYKGLSRGPFPPVRPWIPLLRKKNPETSRPILGKWMRNGKRRLVMTMKMVAFYLIMPGMGPRRLTLQPFWAAMMRAFLRTTRKRHSLLQLPKRRRFNHRHDRPHFRIRMHLKMPVGSLLLLRYLRRLSTLNQVPQPTSHHHSMLKFQLSSQFQNLRRHKVSPTNRREAILHHTTFLLI